MVDTRKKSNVRGGGSGFESVVVVPNVEAAKTSSVSFDIETGSSGLKSDCLFTYKRRKIAKVREGGKIQDDLVSQLSEKTKSHLHDESGCSHKGSHVKTTSSDDRSLNHQRNIILEQICQSLDSEGGLRKCIQDALVFHPGSGSRTTVKESFNSSEEFSKCTSSTGILHEGLQNGAKGSVGMTSSDSVNECNHYTVTKLCQGTFSDIIMSEKFAELCSLLLENFQGIKADKLFDLSCINSRMKERVYESSPLLFQSDIQEMWTKLQKVGNDIIALTKCLSDKAMTSFHEKVGDSPRSISKDGKHEFFAREKSDMYTKTEPTEALEPDEIHKCRHCGEKADGKNGLVCDSCEKIYHISCINPPIKEIPTRSWYCTNCTEKEIELPHENCTACERLIASNSPFEEKKEKMEEISDEMGKNIKIHNCKICRDEVKMGDEYKICGHSFCPHNFYHLKCLTSKQLISYGPCWYCPSCLCRGCFTDQDDDKIVLCDGCDHAYHIYCMDPPCSTIPKGKWFCEECDSGIQRIQEARRAYENNISRKRALDGKLKGEEGLKKPGEVDMLLNAAKIMNHDEILVAMGLNN
ncbi:hypothetical protein BUALT_Bualt01G0013600 [Buddleja alternifolia]|uniref:PHD-type domain-containing protein n=1 Tax=Buddleja alternifolia TaxID=168488 RepID=A0AAV6YEK2_9LAMI|nr:hypothetical protein BUALT_Bualt01G0013600 [Buddleja alternifolia]